jgi:diguanylate cyclase (GGDEF)-like protein
MWSLVLASAGVLLSLISTSMWCRAHREMTRSAFGVRLARERLEQIRLAAGALIAASAESTAAVREALEQTARRLDPSLDVTLFFERAGDQLVCVHASGIRAEYFIGHRCGLEEPNSPIASAILARHRIPARGLLVPVVPGDRAFLALPFIFNNGADAVFYAASRSTDVLDAEESLAMLVDVAAPAYRLARERESDREQATIDALTGSLTAQMFRRALVDACGTTRRRPRPNLALLFIDSDNFKSCNDTLGHAAGDIVLRTLARIFSEAAGDEAIVGRNGGDEFCILLGNTSKAGAVRRAELIRRRVEEYDFSHLLDGQRLEHQITASIGVAAFPTDTDQAHRLLELADTAMYHSKRGGRNRVAFLDVNGTPTLSAQAEKE